MKHFILILAAIVFSTGLSLAQTQDSTSAVLQENLPETQMTKKEIRKAAMPEQRNEITIGYGWGTFIDATFIFANGLVTAFSAGHIRTDNYQALGSVNAEYYRVLNKTFSVGGSFSWTGGSADIINKEDVKTGKSHYSAFVIMPSVKAFWFRKKHVAMYSKLSAGIMFIDDYEEGSKSTDYSPLFSLQAGAVCVQAGGQRVRGFVELGIGMTGLIVGGISVAF